MATLFGIPDKPYPLLDAAKDLLKSLKRHQDEGGMKGSYRVGEEKRDAAGQRKIEIIFDFEQDAETSVARFYLGI